MEPVKDGHAAVLVIRPWNGLRIGATVVLPMDKAKRFEAMGVLRILTPVQAVDPAIQQGSTKARRKPMTGDRSAPNGP